MLVVGWVPAPLLWQFGLTGLGKAAPSTSSIPNLSAAVANTGTSTLVLQNGLFFGNGTFAYGNSNRTPAGVSDRKLNVRDVRGIYICQLPNWGGVCFWTHIDPSIYTYCMIVTSNGGWASLGPDKGLVVQLYRVASAGVAAVTNDWFGAVFRAQS
ncbi:hypothetical protein H2200_003033 [Cladophialophora chaetospira]|uniref:Uncharacterized protein n=1 Tax=Cladophialophora chaetospira TaxID=386627 RepID=A0AA38XGQ6_9EURO|nr:hypothetical protein H2200_003033 [Cladophialophora chaetospira]